MGGWLTIGTMWMHHRDKAEVVSVRDFMTFGFLFLRMTMVKLFQLILMDIGGKKEVLEWVWMKMCIVQTILTFMSVIQQILVLK